MQGTSRVQSHCRPVEAAHCRPIVRAPARTELTHPSLTHSTMPASSHPLSRFINTVLRIGVWGLGAALALFMLLLALLVILIGAVWAMLRGKRPVRPLVVGQWQRYAQARMWRNPQDVDTDAADNVVDVQAREVPETDAPPTSALPPRHPGH